ncbi:hypothetical protein KUTeg_023899 [Tegillarca granosa]|uniref:MULE transposase domain-containing protein n=1 Tax=Tegillarca granosa TaxID=220873 RepID=A0ABQ9E483_TEGGR|nr:hypothetical protein KUTeg_023899 [Tegillarca granosa]
MSRRRTSDYVKVFDVIINLLPRRSAVQTIVADFEKAAWAAVRQATPGVTVRGCYFHWSQAIWRKVQEDGLQTRYNDDNATYNIVRKLLALPFLPVQEVRHAFATVTSSVNDDKVMELVDYMERNWIDGATFPIPTWNVFQVADRTNNDLEGWHRRVNHHARDSTPPFYVLIPLFHEEATKLSLQRAMLAESEVRDRQTLYNTLWQRFESGELNSEGFLTAIARVNGPINL